MDGVELEVIANGNIKVIIRFGGNRRMVFMGGSPTNSRRTQKAQYLQLTRVMIKLGIKEQLKFKAPKRITPMTPSMVKREKGILSWRPIWATTKSSSNYLNVIN